jgi:sarcosine oxidase subunit beta
MPEVVVIGAGALGLCTAWELLERGVEDVTVLDARHVAGGSSGLSVGIIETQYLEPLAVEVRVWSMRAFAALERERGLRIVRNGYLRTAHSEAELEAFERSVAIQRELGVADATVLDRAGLARLVSDLRTDDLAGGLFGPSDGYIDGHLYCSLLADAIAERGGRVLARTAVEGHERDSGGRHRLHTSKGTLECERVVNAAGGWAGEVGELLGTPVALLPERHQALHVRLGRELGYVMPSVMDYVPGSGRIGLYVRDEGPGRLIAGLHTEEAMDVVAPGEAGRSRALEFTEQVAERFADRFPGLADAQLGDVWAGIYPMRPDGRPVVGPEPACPSVVTVAGAGGSGLQSSPALGALAADWIVHGEPRAIPGAAVLAPA